MDLKSAIDSAKEKFESDIATIRVDDIGDNESPNRISSRKAASAPASPGKALSVMLPTYESKRPRLLKEASSKSYSKGSHLKASLLIPANEVVDNTDNNDDTKKQSKKNTKGVSMSEVIKLHQDEGVINLLHALPASRRRPSSSYTSSQSPTTSISLANHHHQQQQQRRPSNEVERGQAAKGLSQSTPSNSAAKNLNALFHRRFINPNNMLRNVIDPQSVRPCTQEELIKSPSLEILKQLPDRDYAKLWSSPSRYNIVQDLRQSSSPLHDEAEEAVVGGNVAAAAAASPNGSVTSIESSVSKSQSTLAVAQTSSGSSTAAAAALTVTNLRSIRTRPWKIQTKHFKDILLRTYSTFVQVILSPSSTGLKNSVNINVCDEMIDVLKQLESDPECRAIMITGIGGTFCQGVDLTVLTHDGSADKQRRAAESLASAIKRLVKQILNCSKILVAAVNGKACGLAVTLLPYFDVVYASDKAEFSMEYSRLGQIPEGFMSSSTSSAYGGCKQSSISEMLYMGHCLTARMAQEAGLVSSVIWPSSFLEEIVPRLESLEFMNAAGGGGGGLFRLKQYMKKSLKEQVLKIMEAETQELASNWSSLEFAKRVKQYLKNSHVLYQ